MRPGFGRSVVGQDSDHCALLRVVAAKKGARQSTGDPVLGQSVDLLRVRQVTNVPHQLLAAFRAQVEPGILGNVGLRQGVFANVDEQGPRQWLVSAILDGGVVWSDATRATINTHQLQLVLVLRVVGVAEETKAMLVSSYPLHQNVVVLAGGVIAAGSSALFVNHLGEVVECAGVDAWAVQPDFLIGPLRADLVPPHDLALCIRTPEVVKLGDGHAVDVVVCRVGHNAETVDGHRDLDVLDARLGAGCDFLAFDRPGGVGDVGLAVAELLETAAAAGETHGYPNITIGQNAELFGHRFADREYGAGTIDGDAALEAHQHLVAG